MLDRVDDWVFVFGDPALAIEALVATLAGLQRPTAHLPVTVPGIDR